MINTLEIVLLLLLAAVLVVGVFRRLNLPTALGYLAVGALLGPHAGNLVADPEAAGHLAEFGVVFLMFTIGLEFSLHRLKAMRRLVFGLGSVQVLGSIAVTIPLAHFFGVSLAGGFGLGAVLAMSSTALLSRLLADRLELDSAHGKEVIGVLLFQDIAVVPVLILIPALSGEGGALGEVLAVALLKAVVMLALVLGFGQKILRRWFFIIARRKTPELFVLNVLLITLGLAWLSEAAGLSLALGAFLGGMLISETEYRYQVEEDIKPFRDILLGLFFVTVGMFLNVGLIIENWLGVLGVLLAMLVLKFVLVALASRAFGSSPGTAMRSGLWLACGGEFGFVLVSEIGGHHLVGPEVLQAVVAALVLSLLVAPFIVQVSDKLVMRFVASEWLLRSMQLTQLAAQSMFNEQHIIVCGYGRTGQYMGRFLEQEQVGYLALDLDPERVREAAAAGDTVVYGDAARRETLMAAGIMRAQALVITFSRVDVALHILHHVHALRPDLPVVARASGEVDMEKLLAAGAAEIIPEAFESGIMLASHALALVGVPLNRVLRRIREIRLSRYETMRGFFQGQSDEDELNESQSQRLHSVVLGEGAWAIGRCIGDLALGEWDVMVSAVRRRGIRGVSPDAETLLEKGDVLVLLGGQLELLSAEKRVLEGV